MAAFGFVGCKDNLRKSFFTEEMISSKSAGKEEVEDEVVDMSEPSPV